MPEARSNRAIEGVIAQFVGKGQMARPYLGDTISEMIVMISSAPRNMSHAPRARCSQMPLSWKSGCRTRPSFRDISCCRSRSASVLRSTNLLLPFDFRLLLEYADEHIYRESNIQTSLKRYGTYDEKRYPI